MLKSLVLLICITHGVSANIYYYQPNGCEYGKLYRETNEVKQYLACSQTADTFMYYMHTSESILPSQEWNNYSYAEISKYSTSECLVIVEWDRIRLGDDIIYYTIGGNTRARCENVNGKEYLYYEDALGQKFSPKETNACVQYGNGYAFITCHKKTLTTSSSSTTSSTSSLTTSSIVIQSSVKSLGVRMSVSLGIVFVLFFLV